MLGVVQLAPLDEEAEKNPDCELRIANCESPSNWDEQGGHRNYLFSLSKGIAKGSPIPTRSTVLNGFLSARQLDSRLLQFWI